MPPTEKADGSKSTGVNQIPPKLVSLASDDLAVPLLTPSIAAFEISYFPRMQKLLQFAL